MIKLPLDYKPATVLNKVVPLKWNTRIGILRLQTLGICVHHTGNMGWNAWVYWNAMQKKYYTDKASYHFIIDLNGEIWMVIYPDEQVYGSGAFVYTKIGKDVFFSAAYKYTVDIEVCVASPNYYMTSRQLEVLAELCADLCIHYKLDPYTQIYRHHDIAKDKPECPWHLLQNNYEWDKVLSMAARFYRLKTKDKYPYLDIKYRAA